jgi:hypothetical protein
MRKKQTRWLFVTLAITIILSASILFTNHNQFQILLAQNNNSESGSNNTSLVKAATTIKNPYIVNSTIGNGPAMMKPTPALSSSDATNILTSFLNPKNLLGTAMDQIRNSTLTNDNRTNVTSGAGNAAIFVRNPGILILSHQIIPPHDFIPVYNSMPYVIMNGQIYAKLPCDSNSKPSLQILAGQLSRLKPAQLNLITALSQPGSMCMYDANLTSTTNVTGKLPNADNIVTSGGVGSGVRAGNLTITYIELFNPTNYRIVLPSTASLSISVNQVRLEELNNTNASIRLNQSTPPPTPPTVNQSTPPPTPPTVNQSTPPPTPPTVNQSTIKNPPNQLTKIGISPSIAFVYNAWNPYLKQKTYLPIAPLLNETILSNSQCAIHAVWHSSKEEQSDLAELKEYSIVTTKNSGNAPMPLHLCGGAPIP